MAGSSTDAASRRLTASIQVRRWQVWQVENAQVNRPQRAAGQRGSLGDLAELFDNKGDAAACSCMWFRVQPKTFRPAARPAIAPRWRTRVAAGEEPGLIAYDGERPCRLGVRRAAAGLRPHRDSEAERGEVGEEGVWSVVCFFIAPGQRKKGVASSAAGVRRSTMPALTARACWRLTRSIGPGPFPTATRTRASFRCTPGRASARAGRFDRWAAVPDASGSEPKRLTRPPGRPVMRLEL